MVDITLNETEVHMLLRCVEEKVSKQKYLIEQIKVVSDLAPSVTAASVRHHQDILFDLEATRDKLKAKAYWTLHSHG